MSTSTMIPQVASVARRVLPTRSRPGWVLSAMDRLEDASSLDPLAKALRKAVRALPLGRGRDILHGRWLGHPVHPLMVQVPIGAWLSAAVLDLVPGERRAARTLVGVGLSAAAPAAIVGWVDWAEQHPQQARVGLVHAAANSLAVGLYLNSFTARRAGHQVKGRALAFAGLAAVGFGGALGGHMAYRQAAGVNHAEAVQHLVGPGWHELGEVTGFPLGEPVRRSIGEVPVFVLRESGGAMYVLAERCSHMAGPLSEGQIADGCVRCPWHGSVFRLSDGWNVHGPATAPQPSFDTRIVDGRLQARLRHGRIATRARRHAASGAA